MNREHLRFKCPVPIENIQNKRVHVSFSRNNGVSVETGVGEIMVTSNATGMSLAWIQFRDESNQEWVHLYLNEERVNLLSKVVNPQYDFVIESVLDAGKQLGKYTPCKR